MILTATLDDDHGLGHENIDNYNIITDLSGTNDPSRSDFDCQFISVVGGSGEVVDSETIVLDSLLIKIGMGTPCDAGTVTVAAENYGVQQINAQVDQMTGCGYITADLFSDEDETTRIQ